MAEPGLRLKGPGGQGTLHAGCQVAAPLMDAFWGDRYGKVIDPYGHQWGIATHKEDLSEDEMAKRGAEWFASMAQAGGEK